MELKTTNVFTRNRAAYEDDRIRFIVNQGGSRSSKTISILQLILVQCLLNPQLRVSIVRKHMTTLRNTAMKDFFIMLSNLNYYNEKFHNKTLHTYTFPNGSVVEFFGAEDGQKLRGSERDLLYINEANDLSFKEYNELIIRTKGKMILDFNPSDTEHWIYDLLNDQKSVLIKSTYRDNPFLNKDMVDYIEGLIKVDLNYYKVYALGERPVSDSRIYNHFRIVDSIPTDLVVGSITYGLDFGYTHVSALVKVTKTTCNKYFVEELLYVAGKDPEQLRQELEMVPGVRDYSVYCDGARPEIIAMFKKYGIKAISAVKDVKPGIDTVRSAEVYIISSSTNLLREYKLYQWKMKGELILDEPIKLNDDALDAMRYAMHSSKKKKFGMAVGGF